MRWLGSASKGPNGTVPLGVGARWEAPTYRDLMKRRVNFGLSFPITDHWGLWDK